MPKKRESKILCFQTKDAKLLEHNIGADVWAIRRITPTSSLMKNHIELLKKFYKGEELYHKLVDEFYDLQKENLNLKKAINQRNSAIAKKFDESCSELVRKMTEFEKEYFCAKCNATECQHLRKDMNKKFKKEIDENTRLVFSLAETIWGSHE